MSVHFTDHIENLRVHMMLGISLVSITLMAERTCGAIAKPLLPSWGMNPREHESWPLASSDHGGEFFRELDDRF